MRVATTVEPMLSYAVLVLAVAATVSCALRIASTSGSVSASPSNVSFTTRRGNIAARVAAHAVGDEPEVTRFIPTDRILIRTTAPPGMGACRRNVCCRA